MSYLDLAVGIGAGLATVAAVFGLVAWLVGRQSHERRGVIRFDTPGARTALRRCNPDRRVHYYGAGDRCECGEHENIYLDIGGPREVVHPRVLRTVEGWPPEPHLLRALAAPEELIDAERRLRQLEHERIAAAFPIVRLPERDK